MSQFTEQYQRLGMSIPETTDLIAKAEAIYVAACAKLGLAPADLPDVSKVREKYRVSQIALHKLQVVRDAITEDKEANWDNREYKYGSWFYMNSPGFRFGGVGFDVTFTDVTGGSRLCTFSEEDQEFFSEECIALWADFYGSKLPA